MWLVVYIPTNPLVVSAKLHVGITRCTACDCTQDRMVVAMDTATGSLLVAVFDGHGQNGHKVSDHFLQIYPPKLFQDRRFATSPVEAMTDVLAAVEDQLIRGAVITSVRGWLMLRRGLGELAVVVLPECVT